MAFQLRRGMIRQLGPGFAVTDHAGNPLPGRWTTYEEAYEQGYLGVYLLSGVHVAELVDVGGRLQIRICD
jgi:hypothetical protein